MAPPSRTTEYQRFQTETIKSYLDELKKTSPESQVRRIRKILHEGYSGRAPKPTEFGPRMQLSYALKDLPEKKYFPKWPHENKEIAQSIQRGKFEKAYRCLQAGDSKSLDIGMFLPFR